jgi:hypothetical protein
MKQLRSTLVWTAVAASLAVVAMPGAPRMPLTGAARAAASTPAQSLVGAQRTATAIDELAATVADGFTMASVGDLILAYPQSQNEDPALRSVMKLLQELQQLSAPLGTTITIEGQLGVIRPGTRTSQQ